MTRHEMLQRMPSTEFSEWIAFASIEPIGDARADMQAAIIACTFANYFKAANGSKSKPCSIEDFMPKFDPPKQQSADYMKAIMKTLSGKA